MPDEEDTFECTECNEIKEGEPEYVSPPKPPAGIPDVICDDCYQEQKEWEKKVGLHEGPEGSD